MKNKKPIAYVFSDIHLHEWKNNYGVDRLGAQFNILDGIYKKAKRHGVPILFAGDLFHVPEHISNNLLNRTLDFFDNRTETDWVFISGNHDIKGKSRVGEERSTLIDAVTRNENHLHNVDEQSIILMAEQGYRTPLNIIGIPYIHGNVDFDKAVENARGSIDTGAVNILLIHTDLHGATDPSGRTTGTVENIPLKMTKFFVGFDLVLSGHIHLHERLAKGIYMVGAPCQQRVSDANNDMGYMVIYNDLSIKFINAKAPEFRYLKPGEPIPSNEHMWIYEDEEKPTQEEAESEFIGLNRRSSIAKAYLKATGEKSKTKRKFLINLLNSVE